MTAPATLFDRSRREVSMTAANSRALILDDSEVDRTRLRRICRQAELDLEFKQCGSIPEFAAMLDGPAFDIVFLDYRLVQGDGLIALDMLRRHPIQKSAAAIMIAGEAQIQVAVDALKNGCNDFIVKENLGPNLIYRAVRNAMENRALKSALSSEEENRVRMQASLGRFAKSCGAEMRTILSSMLRHSRAMRRQAASGAALGPDDLAAMEKSCERLWDFLEEFQAFVSEASKDQRVN